MKKKTKGIPLLITEKDEHELLVQKEIHTSDLVSDNTALSYIQNKVNRNDKLLNANKIISDYKFALDESSIVAVTNQKGVIIHVNDNFCKISQYSREELIGQDHRIINSGYHDKSYIKNIWATISTGKIWKGELKNRAKDGTIYWVYTTIVPFINEKGLPYQYIAIRSDITESKKLEEQQALFSLIINSSDDAIFSYNADGLFTSWNPGAEKQFGYSFKEIIGKYITIIIPHNLLEEENEIMIKIKNGLTINHYETLRRKKDGELINVSLTVSPIINLKGEFLGVSKISRNITDRKVKENEIIKLNNEISSNDKKFKGLIENSYDLFVLLDKDLNIVYRSPSNKRMLGWSNEDRKNVSLMNQVHSHDITLLKNTYKKVLLNPGKRFLINYRMLHKNGHYIWIEGIFTNMLHDVSINGIIGNFHDVTEQKETKRVITEFNEGLEQKVAERTYQLQEANEELESFTYSVSHDLRAPLRAINGFTQILKEDYTEQLDDEAKQILIQIIGNSKKMGQLIDDLLSFSRLGRLHISRKNVNIKELVDEVIIELKQAVPKRKLTIIINKLENSYCDRNMIKQVFINLISNALKYTSKNNEAIIEIGSYLKDENYIYFVKDNGVGFDMRYYDKLFGVFQRLHSSNEFEGTGVGLAIVKKIISKHDGKVWAESKIDEGASFYISLPIIK